MPGSRADAGFLSGGVQVEVEEGSLVEEVEAKESQSYPGLLSKVGRDRQPRAAATSHLRCPQPALNRPQPK